MNSHQLLHVVGSANGVTEPVVGDVGWGLPVKLGRGAPPATLVGAVVADGLATVSPGPEYVGGGPSGGAGGGPRIRPP